MDERAMENLANAVVKMAAEDYRKALIKLKKVQDRVDELERFFDGNDIKIYTSLDGTALKERLKQQVIDCHYDMTAIRKQNGGKEEEET